MFRYRLALGVFAAAIALLPLTSAWAFSQQSAGGGDGNSSFADPDDRLRTVSASDRSIRTSSRCSSACSSKVHLIPFGGSNRYTATALIIRRSGPESERGRLTGGSILSFAPSASLWQARHLLEL
jgi:hypothetical protein